VRRVVLFDQLLKFFFDGIVRVGDFDGDAGGLDDEMLTAAG